MAISASDVKKLRDMTGAGMMDCKKALTEANGDFDKAIEELRKKGQKLSAKRADRDTTEGVVIAKTSGNRNNGVVVKLGCETDFVAKGEGFISMADKIAEIALKELPTTVDDLKATAFGDGMTIGEKVIEQTGVIGEKISLNEYAKIETAAGEGQVLPYIHMGYKAGVLVALNLEGPQFVDAGKDVAMQVAAMKPIAVNQDGVDQATIDKEIEIGKELAKNEGKPEAMLERIATGRLNKFFKETTLLPQAFVKDSKKSVDGYLKDQDPNLTVTDFKHISLG
ncbi:MAG: translation elongation factor Ts [Saprospiraceae bacterium]|nr:translation elongation factor Ts [Saprospiraceae bacterium]|tara:strand:- start:824 stop:1666 length:843 start_codon:yes stop_codon:yes gene_type:complete